MYQRYSKAVLGQGKHLKQNDLSVDFQDKTVGQSPISKNALVLLIVILSSIANILSGFAGGVLSSYSVIANEGRSQFQMALFIILIVIVTAVIQDILQVTLVAVTIFGTAILISGVLAITGLTQQSFLVFSTTVIAATGVCLGLSGIGFLAMRFVLALADILLIRARPLKFFIYLVSAAAALVGCFGVLTGFRENAEHSLYNALNASTFTYQWVLLLGIGYGMAVTFSAWWANYRRGTPWTYPGTQRFLALAVGSWWGTSFVNLDLSNVSFRNARLANSDLRARTLYRTCFQGATGLERARVDNQYLDLAYPKVQKLLTNQTCQDSNFRRFNLQGAYLQNADLRGFDFTDANLTGADLKGADLRESILVQTRLAGADFQDVDLRKNLLIDTNLTEANFRGADLRGCILVRAQVARTDFTGADLSGICIEDWSVSSQTRFTDVRCDYVYRKYQDEVPSDRYPVDRNFEPGEFATLFAAPEDIVELVFKGEFDYGALSLSLYKLQTEAPDLDIELKGIENRGNLWVVKVKSANEAINERLVEERLSSVYQETSTGEMVGETVSETIKGSIYRDYEETRHRLAESERLIRQLAGLSEDQAEALKEMSKKSLGNHFTISGSTITNLAGSGQIEYREAADRVRSLVTNPDDRGSALQQFLSLLNHQNIATTTETQQDLIQQVLLSEARKDPQFQTFLLEQGDQIMSRLLGKDTSMAVKAAIAQLSP